MGLVSQRISVVDVSDDFPGRTHFGASGDGYFATVAFDNFPFGNGFLRIIGSFGMDMGLLALLFLVAVTGLALLFFRHTSAMGWLLVIHLGFVLAFFATLPYGKFVHGLYRFAAILRHHADQRSHGQQGD